MKKFGNVAKVIVCCLCCVFTMVFAASNMVEPIKASAVWHWDFWNDYEDFCTVVYSRISNLNGYKVMVYSYDGQRVWVNDDPAVPYWYPESMLEEMIGRTPNYYSGYVNYVSIRSDLLADTDYFFKYTTI